MRTCIALSLLLGLAACRDDAPTHSITQAIGNNPYEYDVTYAYNQFSDLDSDDGPFLCYGNCDWGGESQHPGTIQLRSTATTSLNPTTTMNSLVLGGAYTGTYLQALIKLEDLPDETDDFVFALGFCDRMTPPCAYGAWVESTSLNDLWHCEARNGAETEEVAVNGSSIPTGTWMLVEVAVNIPGTPFLSIAVNGGSYECNTSDDDALPLEHPVAPFLSIQPVVGDERSVTIDYVRIHQDWSTTRVPW